MEANKALFTNDAVVLGILIIILAVIFKTEKMKAFKKFYKFVPALLLCYFVPSLLNSFRIISGDNSKLYFMASRYLLPTSLVLLTLSIDLKRILQLGPKAIIMFLTGTVGVLIGGPLAILIVSFISPETVGGHGPEAVWRGMTTVAGSWIGGGANMAAMKEVFQVSDKIFSAMVAVDVLVASVWMAFLLYGAGISDRLDNWFKADSSAINELKERVENFQKRIAKIPDLTDLIIIAAFGFGATALSHFLADIIAPFISNNMPFLDKFSLTSKFFWLIVIATTVGLILSFTKAKNLEGAGCSKIGSVFIYILVATIGMKMDVTAVISRPGVFLVGFIWIAFHALLLIVVAKIIKAPVFFLAVGSQANIGGAASAPVVASAFHLSLAPVGVLLAVFGYAIGTYAAYICGLLMQAVSP
jgi:uncharacterized membrane protein